MSRRPDHIITRPEILGLLKRINDGRALLTIKLDEETTSYSSTILGINERKNLILIDDFFPAPGIYPGRNAILHCFTRLDGICVNFSCQLKASSAPNYPQVLHQLSMPTRIHYHQRRRHYRVPLSWTTASLNARLARETGFSATVLNISASGIGARLDGNQQVHLEKDMLIHDCTVIIQNNKSFTAPIMIRSVRQTPDDERICFGAEFTRLENNQVRHIQRLVALLDRETCQIRTRQA